MSAFVNFIIVTVIGLLAGLASGLMGVGGGVVITPLLVLLLGLDPKTAAGTSLAALIPPVGLFAVLQYHRNGNVNFTYAAIIAVCLAVGSFVSAKFALQMPQEVIRRVFAVGLVTLGLRLLLFK